MTSTETRIRNALRRTWEYIAYDVSQLFDGSMRRDQVIECVLDANYAEAYGDDAEAIMELRKISYEQQVEAAKEEFRYEWYE